MQNLKTNIYFKIGTIIFITLLLLIPTTMIKGLIHEREYTEHDAINEVSNKWGEKQTIAGPIISIPFTRYVKSETAAGKTIEVKEFIHILPSELNITGKIYPTRRYRGIYETVVYNSKVHIAGNFSKLNLNSLDIPLKDIQLDKASLTVGINDLRGIEKQVKLKWNNTSLLFNPGVTSNDIANSGINAIVDIDSTDNTIYDFSFDLDLNGSQLLYFTPVGKITDIKIKSTWQNPSFNGAFLPDSRKVSDSGFVAHWNILHLNRNYPQMWTGSSFSISESSFGIDLLLPVDNYQKSYRTIQYAILFIGFTFLAFFFIEVLNKVFIHPIQYILVGIALVVFYTLLLSFSEHLSYNLAFMLAAVSTLLLIAGYVKAILKSNKLTVLISGILLILYTFIFVIIQLQDFAFLIGSIGIFLVLAFIMYFSRKIDWYNMSIDEKIE